VQTRAALMHQAGHPLEFVEGSRSAISTPVAVSSGVALAEIYECEEGDLNPKLSAKNRGFLFRPTAKNRHRPTRIVPQGHNLGGGANQPVLGSSCTSRPSSALPTRGAPGSRSARPTPCPGRVVPQIFLSAVQVR